MLGAGYLLRACPGSVPGKGAQVSSVSLKQGLLEVLLDLPEQSGRQKGMPLVVWLLWSFLAVLTRTD